MERENACMKVGRVRKKKHRRNKRRASKCGITLVPYSKIEETCVQKDECKQEECSKPLVEWVIL